MEIKVLKRQKSIMEFEKQITILQREKAELQSIIRSTKESQVTEDEKDRQLVILNKLLFQRDNDIARLTAQYQVLHGFATQSLFRRIWFIVRYPHMTPLKIDNMINKTDKAISK